MFFFKCYMSFLNINVHLTTTHPPLDNTIMPATLGGEVAKLAVLGEWASQTIRPWQWQWGLSRSVTSPSLCLSLPFFSSPCFPLLPFHCLILSMFQTHTHTRRQNIFISRLYAAVLSLRLQDWPLAASCTGEMFTQTPQNMPLTSF